MVRLVSASVTAATALLALVSAADYRLLVEKPSCVTMDQFNARSVHLDQGDEKADTLFSFTQLCPVFPDAGAPFNATSHFVPGDYSGDNTDSEYWRVVLAERRKADQCSRSASLLREWSVHSEKRGGLMADTPLY